MKSPRPKVLCEVLFKPMIRWVEDACRAAGIDDIIVVAGDDDGPLREVCPNCSFVRQTKRLGTGHALLTAKPLLKPHGHVLALNGDGPLISAETIRASLEHHLREGNAMTLVAGRLDNPTGFGRVLQNPLRVVEEKDADEATRAIRDANGGIYWFDAAFLARALVLESFHDDNAQKEYYILDLIGAAQKLGLTAGVYVCPDGTEILGANDRAALARLNETARNRIIERHLENGVDIPFRDGVVIGPDAALEPGARVLPGTMLLGDTRVGAECEIGPNSRLVDARVGAGSKVWASWLTKCTLGENCSVGPFAQFRPGTHLGSGVKVGDFVELKNTSIGDKTSVAHLTYLGDCDIGSNCNFGCGVVTANYDGRQKYRTSVGDRAFIGCNTNIISPVNIGDGAYTAAGTTVDSDVPPGALAIGRSRQEVKEGWADRKIGFKK